MKRLIYLYVIFFTLVSYSQNLNFEDIGVLFSQESTTLGTARYNGTNGALGAIGGDLSAINTNPAGAAVYNNSEFAFSLGIENLNLNTKYYNSLTTNSNTNFNLNQIGGVIVFDNSLSNPDWDKVTFAINMQRTQNFNFTTITKGNSGIATFVDHGNGPLINNDPNTPVYFFDQAQQQNFINNFNGENMKFSFTLAGEYLNKVYLGASLNFHNLNFLQELEFNETNSDNAGNLLNSFLDTYDNYNANGFSMSVGIILKPTHAIRLGASIESPTWYYNIVNEHNIFDGRTEDDIALRANNNKGIAQPIQGDIFQSTTIETINDYEIRNELDILEYALRTPVKANLSGGLVLGKLGFVNLDYTYKAFNTIQLHQNGIDFTNNNSYFNEILKNTHTVKVGGEIRLGTISLRGGLGYEQSPFNDAINNKTDISVIRLGDKYSAGAGIGFLLGNKKLDFAYNRSSQTNHYDFYPQYNAIETSSIENNINTITATLTFLF